MKAGNWNNIKNCLHTTLIQIFSDCDITLLSSYQKRKMIFEYLCNNLSYDYDLLERIRDFNLNKTPIVRELYLELENAMFNKKGICNAISQYYKLLLEEIGIKAFCVVCDDGTSVNHQLNLVFNEESGNYSFDDVTSVIVGRGSITDYFDYDLEFANSINQGNKPVFENDYWVIIPEDYIDFLVGRQTVNKEELTCLPQNIFSSKSSIKY